jgi:hypothetical protein
MCRQVDMPAQVVAEQAAHSSARSLLLGLICLLVMLWPQQSVTQPLL